MTDFARQPMLLVGIEEMIVGENLRRLARRFEDDRGDVELVEPDIEDRVVELARELQRPELCAERHHGVGRSRRRRGRPAQRDGGDAFRAIEFDRERAVFDAVRGERARQRRERNAFAGAVARRLCGEFLGARHDGVVEFRARHHVVDQPPFDRALAFDAFLGGAEHVGMVAAHFALVGDAGEPAGAGQHREQRQFRQRHRSRAVVHQHDVVGGERQLIAAAGRGAVDGADGFEPGMLAQILDAVAGLVGELAEVDLVGVGGAGQHADIGAGAEHPRLARAQHHDAHSRMLEAQPLDGVGQFDIDAEIVGIELELVALEQRALLVDVHQQRGDVAVDLELPMAIARRLGLEIDPRLAVGQRTRSCGFSHLCLARHSQYVL